MISEPGEDGLEWQTAGKKKTRKPDASIPTVLKNMREALAILAPKHPGKTVCVLANRQGEIVGEGYSTWKADCNVSENQVLSTVTGASSTFDLGKNKHGTACAEVCALYFLKSHAKYSLSYDNVTKKEKRACGNCGPMLEKNCMSDLCERL